MTIEIPEHVQQFARELAELARKHDVMHLQGWFQPSYQKDWRARVEFDWRAGRHGEDGFAVRLSSTHQVTVQSPLRPTQETPAESDQHIVQTFIRVGPEQGMSTMCKCGQIFAKHIAQDHAGNSAVCPTANR